MNGPAGARRIAFLIRSLGVGGAERQVAALAGGLRSVGHEVTVLVNYGGGAIQRELEAAGVAVVALEKRGRWDLLGPLFRLARELRRRRPEVVHGFMPDANLLSLLAGRCFVKAKVVWGVRASHYDFAIYDWLFRVLFWVSCRLSSRADIIIANSTAGRDYHVACGYPMDRCVVVPNGIDISRFRPEPARRASQRQTWGVGDGEVLIGLVGRLDPMKGHPTFLRAASLLAAQLPRARFLCLGEGPPAYLGELQALAGRLGIAERVRWVLRADDLVAAYNALDLLGSVSTSGEGFSNVIGEAMACGVRCVVTDVGDAGLIVGETGIVVPAGDATALAAACRRLLAAPVEDIASPRSRIETEYALQRLVARMETLLREVCTDIPAPNVR